MKLEIYGEKPEEKVARLRLVRLWRGVCLAIVDEDGVMVNCGALLDIEEDMKPSRPTNSCAAEYGFETDGEGRIVIE